METTWLAAAFFLVALVYAAVGQAGGTGYLAAMAFADLSPLAMRTTALSLNLVVAAIGTALFLRAGRLAARSVWPFAVLGFPFSVLGGAVRLPAAAYEAAVGVVLLAAAALMARTALRGPLPPAAAPAPPPFLAALATGAAIGFISGATGSGGGVFLAPVILAMGWATARETAPISAVYNLANSAAALIGLMPGRDAIPPGLPLWLLAVAAGGACGAAIGRGLSERRLRLVLAALLALSGLRLLA